jgi:hypothetical protein
LAKSSYDDETNVDDNVDLYGNAEPRSYLHLYAAYGDGDPHLHTHGSAYAYTYDHGDADKYGHADEHTYADAYRPRRSTARDTVRYRPQV